MKHTRMYTLLQLIVVTPDLYISSSSSSSNK